MFKMLGNLRNGLIPADQSERISQLVSQITLSHFRISQITQARKMKLELECVAKPSLMAAPPFNRSKL